MHLVARALRLLLLVMMAALVAAVTAGVVFRYGLGASLYWATEVPNFLLVWIVFLGAAVAWHEGKHIAFTVVADRLPALPRRVLDVATAVLLTGFFVFLVIIGFELVDRTMQSRSEALKMPLGLLYLCIPVAAGLMALDTLASLPARLRGTR
ncbi:TRAP transporter small permease [Elioraea sp.]|uniref:TRAP transporter small permease n=1 Tax=Elioraea sp. TaxID=2185103 RepID=UPI0025C2E751|nr:TRAP transporter small permease [Elioraea sp.]